MARRVHHLLAGQSQSAALFDKISLYRLKTTANPSKGQGQATGQDKLSNTQDKREAHSKLLR